MIQTAFLTLFIILLIWFPSIYPLLPSLKASHSPLMYLFPPFWFVGLGETMIGRVDSTFSVYGHIITVAFVLPFGLYLLSMPRFFRKFLKTKQTPRYSLKPSKIKAFFKKEFDNLILKNSLERGSFYFSLKTLNRCKKNKMHLLTFLIIPAILISIGLTILYLRFDASFFRTINIFLVALPLVLIFFLIWGMRMTITHAVHPPANWIFVLKSSRENNFFLTGVKKAFVFSMILPLLVSLFFIYLYLWNLPAATGHTFFCLACAILLMSLVFIHYPQIPFINPPPSNGRMYTFFFLTGFLGFSYLFSLLGLFLLKNPEYYILFYLSVALAFFLLKWIDYTAQGKLTFTYDKLLDRVMIHLEQDTPDKKSIH
jgi:hypothetical protein